MKLAKAQKLKTLSEILNCEFVGDPDFLIQGLNEIHRVEEGDLVFVDHPKYYDAALNSKASAVLIDQKVDAPEGKALLISKSVFSDFNKLIRIFKPEAKQRENIDPSAKIHPSAYIAPGVIIGANVEIGEDSHIMPNVVLYEDSIIGKRVRIHANSCIGSDAFYYQKKEGIHSKFESCGGVRIEDDVEIGSACTIDRGVTHWTIIGEGSKLDNQVQIGHDTVIGKNCLLAGQVGVAGCTNIGDNSVLWGQVGVAANIEIGENVTILAQSGISKSLKSGQTYFGYPAEEARSKYKELAILRRLIKKES